MAALTAAPMNPISGEIGVERTRVPNLEDRPAASTFTIPPPFRVRDIFAEDDDPIVSLSPAHRARPN